MVRNVFKFVVPQTPPLLDTCAKKILLVSMGGLAEGVACADLGARTPIGTSGHFFYCFWPQAKPNGAVGEAVKSRMRMKEKLL